MPDKETISHSDTESGSESDDVGTTGLIATRQKRSTAGNLYATYRDNLDDEELQRALFDGIDEDEDAGEYDGSDKDDDDDILDSSSDEDDAGPPREGEEEELTGEKDLKKRERAEARKKRKLHEARLKLPMWQKKRVKLADGVKVDGGATERPKKKSERANWLPSAADAPTRQSGRSLAVANREIVHANLRESFERLQKQRRAVPTSGEEEKPRRREDLTQEQRLHMAAKIEKQTEKEFGRWEVEEAERKRLRDEQIAAKRRKCINGPIVRHWSGSVIWEGDRIRDRRVLHGSTDPNKTTESQNTAHAEDNRATESAAPATPAPTAPKTSVSATSPQSLESYSVTQVYQASKGAQGQAETISESNAPATQPSLDVTPIAKPVGSKLPENSKTAEDAEDKTVKASSPPHIKADVPNSSETPARPFLPGASSTQPAQTSQSNLIATEPAKPSTDISQDSKEKATKLGLPQVLQHSKTEPSLARLSASGATTATSTEVPAQTASASAKTTQLSQPARQALLKTSSQQPQIYHGWPPGAYQFTVNPRPAAPQPPPAVRVPLIRQQAQRSLVILEQFEELEKTATVKAKKTVSALEPTIVATALLGPQSYPSFNTEETRYLTSKYKKRGMDHFIPTPPPKRRCAISSWHAKFRDPKTGLAYADMQAYKTIQRILAGGAQWSALLGAYVGTKYGAFGRAASGVPEGFSAPPAAPTVKADAD